MNKYKIRMFCLSALVFPGLGQMLGRRTRRGAVLIGLTLLAFYLVISGVLPAAQQAAASIVGSGQQADYGTLNQAANQALGSTDSLRVSAGIFLFLVVWLLGMLDAVFGKTREQEDADPSHL